MLSHYDLSERLSRLYEHSDNQPCSYADIKVREDYETRKDVEMLVETAKAGVDGTYGYQMYQYLKGVDINGGNSVARSRAIPAGCSTYRNVAECLVDVAVYATNAYHNTDKAYKTTGDERFTRDQDIVDGKLFFKYIAGEYSTHIRQWVEFGKRQLPADFSGPEDYMAEVAKSMEYENWRIDAAVSGLEADMEVMIHLIRRLRMSRQHMKTEDFEALSEAYNDVLYILTKIYRIYSALPLFR